MGSRFNRDNRSNSKSSILIDESGYAYILTDDYLMSNSSTYQYVVQDIDGDGVIDDEDECPNTHQPKKSILIVVAMVKIAIKMGLKIGVMNETDLKNC